MKLNKILSYLAVVIALVSVMASCQKMDRPSLGDYPKDPAPKPAGPLKLFTAFEGTPLDSQQAVYGIQINTTYDQGIKGQAYKGTKSSYIKFANSTEFAKSTSFTVSFWMKKDGPPAGGSGTQWVFGLPTTGSVWHAHEMFFFFEDANNPSSAALAACKFMIQDQWFEFVGTKRIPNLLNNQWHHVAFVYNQATSKLATYVDGVQQYPNDASVTDVKNGGNPRGALSFKDVSGFVIGGPGHHAINKTPDGWMGNFEGLIDQFRLYGVALTQAEITALFNNKD